MEENQIKKIISIYVNNINLNIFNNIINAAFSGNTKIKKFSIEEYFNYCQYHEHFKLITIEQLECVLNYLSLYYKNHISINSSEKKYITKAYPQDFKLKEEYDILKILEIYNQEIKFNNLKQNTK
jgi:hypothetical protein